MNKVRKNEYGFSAVEIIIGLLVVGSLAGVGFYVYSNKSDDKGTANKSTVNTSQTKPADTVTTPEQGVIQLTTVFKSKDKTKFESLISDEMKADAKANDVSSVYDSFAEDEFSASIFTGVDYSKEKAKVTEYTSKKGVKGKTVTYSITTESDNAKSVNVFTFSLVPKGSGWLLDDMNLDSNSSADIST